MRDATDALAYTNGVATSETPIIECRGLQKWYAGVHALKNVSLKIRRGEILGLVGDNGAGKSTLIKILSGVLQPDSGLTLLEGAEVKIRNPKDAMRLGIETIYQYNSMVPTMTIARNLFIGREPLKWSLFGIGAMDLKSMRDAQLHDGRPRRALRLWRSASRQPRTLPDGAGPRHADGCPSGPPVNG